MNKKKIVMDIGNFGYMDKKGNIYQDELDLALHYMTKKQYSEWQNKKYKTPYNEYLDKWFNKWEVLKPKDTDEIFQILKEWGYIK